MSHPVEFILWMTGFMDCIGKEPPTKEEWAKLRDKHDAAVGALAASKLLEDAEDVRVRREQEADQFKLYKTITTTQPWQNTGTAVWPPSTSTYTTTNAATSVATDTNAVYLAKTGT